MFGMEEKLVAVLWTTAKCPLASNDSFPSETPAQLDSRPCYCMSVAALSLFRLYCAHPAWGCIHAGCILQLPTPEGEEALLVMGFCWSCECLLITGFSLRHNNISPSLFLCLNTFVSALWKQFNGYPILLNLHGSFQQLRAILVSRLFKNVCYLSGF